MKKQLYSLPLLTLLLSPSLFAATVDLRILETSDIHSNIMDYDYYRDIPTERYGLARTATLIQQERKTAKNSVLIDNGDLIQGSPLADYAASKGLKKGEQHPVHLALNYLKYTVGNIGNHEFNYGLDYLNNAINGADFPYVNANIFDAKTDKPYFKQYIIVDTPVVDRKGKKHTLKIAYIGFVPPQVLQWDKQNLDGKVVAKDITRVAKMLVPEVRAKGADLVVILAHSGLSPETYQPMAENSVYYLSKIKGIDVIAFGHAHAVFPSKQFESIHGVNIYDGTINGVPAVMPGQFGDHLGVVDLVLQSNNDKWIVTESRAQAKPIFDTKNNNALVESDKKITRIMAQDHRATRRYMNHEIGKSGIDMFSFLATVQDDPTIQIINDAQRDYITFYVKSDETLNKLPILSAAAPFKAGGRKNDPQAYVEVHKGPLSVKSAADLYFYPNTLVTLKITGADVKEWLECSSGIYNQINVNETKPQYLLNWDKFRIYNFDVIDGVNYQIDVTKPARYDGNCQLINQNASRITDLTFNGKPIDPKQEFIMVTNNYRAFSGKFAGTGKEENIIYNSTNEVKEVLSDYIKKMTRIDGEVKPVTDYNWRIKNIETKTPLDIRIETSPSEIASQFITENAQYPMKKLGQDSVGFEVYKIDLQHDINKGNQ